MTRKLKISSFVIKRLEKIKTDSDSGCLFGLMYDGVTVIMGFNLEVTDGVLNYKKIQHSFPAELDLCGLIKFGACSDAKAHLNDIIQDVDVTDNPVLLHCNPGAPLKLTASLFKHGQLEHIEFDIMTEDEIFNEFIHVRLTCNLSITCEDNDKSISTGMQKLRIQLASGETGFNIKDTKIYLTGGSAGTNIIGINSDSEVIDILNNVTVNDAAINGNSNGEIIQNNIKIKKKNLQQQLQQEKQYDFKVINVCLISKLTREKTIDTSSFNALSITIDRDTPLIRIPVIVDALATLYRNTQSIKLYDILIESICRSIRLIEKSILRHRLHSGNTFSDMGYAKIYHFFPDEFGHYFSCVYPSNINDDDEYLKLQRKKLHKNFALPLRRPYFRKINQHQFKNELLDKYLVNPHHGVKSSNVKDGHQYLVTGKYTYFHYMQDNFDDKNWGCAYRSLQTLCSWFRWQGFTNRTIPTHIEIQKYLVNIGDKPSSFIGSRNWIGSTEVSMCLDGFLNIVCRILRVDNGSDLAFHGATLAQHFTSQGTPIMIGGGVLAHTILGVDFNNETNELKFLILDPHYTGADDLTVVQNKGWCGWKGTDFWDKKSYYNLCMPQLPTDKEYY